MFKSFPFYPQLDQMDCGPTCLKMVSKYYGKTYDLPKLRHLCEINRDGVSLLGIGQAAEFIGFKSAGVKISLPQLKELTEPCILHWQQNHFVVFYRHKSGKFFVADPGKNLITYTEKEFETGWISDSVSQKGVALILYPTSKIFEQREDVSPKVRWGMLSSYLTPYKRLLLQLFLGLIVGTLFNLILPLMTQSVVDIGINTKNIGFIYVILIAQLVISIGQLSVDFIRSWILLFISTRINIRILTQFLFKLMNLPSNFFDVKMSGDIMQRFSDQHRIEIFLTGSAISALFSIFNLLVFGLILYMYNLNVFLVFLIASMLSTIWILLFLKRRRNLDYKNFDIATKKQSNIVQLVSGMQEIKLNNCEQQKRWGWENIQASAFKFNLKTLYLSHYQQAGSLFINQGKNILITFITAKAVVLGDLTLGGMIAIQYIVGQLQSPIEQFLSFIQSFQDAKISLERLNEIHTAEDEEINDVNYRNDLLAGQTIEIRNLSFKYQGAGNKPVLKDISLTFPEGKTTAIVGMSGSGKTTLLKLILRLHHPQEGSIYVGTEPLTKYGFKFWRNRSGVVMQDGFIFSDTIASNITIGEIYDRNKLAHAISIANLEDFIAGLPNGVYTKIGAEGNGISQGQKQRVLIARAVYKDPQYMLFDEATNSLDTKNEKAIMTKLNDFFKGRTVIIVAHRLSTVKNADNIVVLNGGKVVEQGSHNELKVLKGHYYGLVKNQLQL